MLENVKLVKERMALEQVGEAMVYYPSDVSGRIEAPKLRKDGQSADDIAQGTRFYDEYALRLRDGLGGQSLVPPRRPAGLSENGLFPLGSNGDQPYWYADELFQPL